MKTQQSYLSNTVLTLCHLWAIECKNGMRITFTDYIRDLVYQGETYKSSVGFNVSSNSTKISNSVDNITLYCALNDQGLANNIVRTGLLDNASVIVMRANYLDLASEAEVLRTGIVGNVDIVNNNLTIEIRGLLQKLQQTNMDVYSANCRFNLGDDGCKYNLSLFENAVVSSVVSSYEFNTVVAYDNTIFDYGFVLFDTGLNANIKANIDKQVGANIKLKMPMPFAISVGDTLKAYLGCDKTFATCKTRFGNGRNFGGFPFITGRDNVYS